MKFKIGRLKIYVSFLFFALATYYLSYELCSNYILALIFSLFHELGHLIPMFLFGCIPESINIGAFGVSIKKNLSELSYKKELVVTVCGPAVNLFLFLLFHILSFYFTVFGLFRNINFALFFINMLPVGVLDGGRAVHLFLSNQFGLLFADKILFILEIIVSVALIGVLVLSVYFNYTNTSFVFFVVAICCLMLYNCFIMTRDVFR